MFKSYAESRSEDMTAKEEQLKKRVCALEDEVSPSPWWLRVCGASRVRCENRAI